MFRRVSRSPGPLLVIRLGFTRESTQAMKRVSGFCPVGHVLHVGKDFIGVAAVVLLDALQDGMNRQQPCAALRGRVLRCVALRTITPVTGSPPSMPETMFADP